MSENCTHNCETCGESCPSREGGFPKEQLKEGCSVKKVIGIVSGKGGVGKSMVTSLLSVILNRRGYHTAILDADVTGPSIPKAFGLHGRAQGTEMGILPVKSKLGTDIMSVNLLLGNETDPVVWRGPVIAGAVKQFWTDVLWNDVDYMFVDMPPGTGDVPLTVFQSLPVDGIIIVTSPQELVSMIVTNHINGKVLGTRRTMDQSTRMTMFIMPLFSLWICFTLPAALGVYWIANSLFAMLQEVLNIPFLRSFLKKQEEAKVKRREEEKERVKREKQAQAEAKKKAAEEMRRIQMERKLNKSIATASREGIRAYARGRLYDPERYPTFPYQDPNDLAKQAQEEQQRLAEEQKTAKAKGKKGKKDQPNQPTKTEKPAQAAQEEKPSAAPTSAAPEKPVPQPAPVPEEEEGFVEESFLEEPEQDNDEK